MYYTGFCSASLAFLEWLHKQNVGQFSVTSGYIKQSNRALVLNYAKKDSRILFDSMYYNNNLPKLNRKYEKFVDFLEQDPYYNMKSIARVA